MRARFVSRLRHHVSVLLKFSHRVHHPESVNPGAPAVPAVDLRCAGQNNCKLLSPRESAEAAVRLSRTYW
ncbi:hypothetical protein [Cupriavidus pauculus]|uniref:hypothetical protein n=1 Tax=Cupriavidus pauculus TaxID=82633 RepID=UPI0011AF58D5|nr:hypothetical protein [Cupriavidus pauculus]